MRFHVSKTTIFHLRKYHNKQERGFVKYDCKRRQKAIEGVDVLSIAKKWLSSIIHSKERPHTIKGIHGFHEHVAGNPYQIGAE